MDNYVSYSDATELMTAIANKINNSGFITNTVNSLVNYYLKTETYSKTEVDALLQAITTLDIQAVSQLPTTNISTTTIYLVPKQDPQVPDIKDEYINLDGTTSGWELIGNTQIDLSNYVTTSDLTTALQSYATKAYVDGLVGDLSSATTTDKSSVVAMVNELNSAFADYATLGGGPDANKVTKELVYINGFQSGLTNYPSEVSNTIGILFTRWFYYSGDLTVARMQLVFTLVGLSFCRFFDGTSWTPWVSTSVGLLTNLTTTDKSSCVGAINELDWKAGTFGPYNVADATDIKDFIRKVITLADADLASKPANKLYHIFSIYHNSDNYYGTIEKQDTHGYSFVLSAASGNIAYHGYCDVSTNYLNVYSYSGTYVS
jgi:hypothetical protein